MILSSSNNSEKGFTLVEVLVTTLAFSIMAGLVGGVFIRVLNLQRRGFAARTIQENSLFVLELMAKEIRVSRIVNQESADCSRTSIDIEHPVQGTITYSLNTVTKAISRVQGATPADITSGDVEFTQLSFCVTGSSPADTNQPRVTIVATVRDKQSLVTADVQTTVSSRDLSDEL